MTLHNALTGVELHEPKGMSASTGGAGDIGEVVVSKGDGTSEVRKLDFTELATGAADGQIGVAASGLVVAKTSCRMGWSNYGDVATATTPITLTPTATFVDMTDDGASAQTDTTFDLPEVGNLWNVGTSSFDFSDLKIGDTVDIRIDLDITTTGANHEIEVQLDMDTAPIDINFPLLLIRQNFKTAVTAAKLIRFYSLFIGSAGVRDGVHKIQVRSDTGTTDTVRVHGWYIRAITNSDY
jgi:hypothetical protein